MKKSSRKRAPRRGAERARDAATSSAAGRPRRARDPASTTEVQGGVVRAKDGELARLAPFLSRAAAEAVVVDAKDAELKRAGAALAEARNDADKAAEELVKARDAAASAAAAQSEAATEPETAAPDTRDEELARLRAELAEARAGRPRSRRTTEATDPPRSRGAALVSRAPRAPKGTRRVGPVAGLAAARPRGGGPGDARPCASRARRAGAQVAERQATRRAFARAHADGTDGEPSAPSAVAARAEASRIGAAPRRSGADRRPPRGGARITADAAARRGARPSRRGTARPRS